MALFLFTKALLENRPIQVFNYGNMVRDFTYIDDIVEGVTRVIDNPPVSGSFKAGVPEEPATKGPYPNSTDAPLAREIREASILHVPYKIYNIGNASPVPLTEYIAAIEAALGKTAEKEFLPIQPGDVPNTYADVSDLVRDIGYKPATKVEDGMREFIQWYKEFYGVKI